MSYILDALNKSEQERHEQQHAPNLHAVHPQPAARPATGARLLIAALVLALLTTLSLTIWLFWQKQQASPLPTSAPVQPARAQPAVPEPAPAAAPATTPIATANQTAPAAAPAQPASGDIAALYQQPKPTTTTIAPSKRRPTASTEPARIEPSLPPAMVDAARQALSLTPVPSVSELPADVRLRLPKLYYSAHIFSNEEGKGFAIINGQRRYRGDVLGPALFVVELREEGIVLNFENHTFLLDALTDWPPE